MIFTWRYLWRWFGRRRLLLFLALSLVIFSLWRVPAEIKVEPTKFDEIQTPIESVWTPVTVRKVLVGGHTKSETIENCPVTCQYEVHDITEPQGNDTVSISTKSVLLSMESQTNYPGIRVDNAHQNGYQYVMTTNLDSDVPVPYFSWIEYGFMEPVREEKVQEWDAVVVMSNCGAANFRMQAVQELEKLGVRIDKFGHCYKRPYEAGKKVDLLRKYRFYLAFENSIEEDYVTEKFFESLIAGSVPVVIGAPNIHQFAPSPKSLLHLKSLEDCPDVAKEIIRMRTDEDEYKQYLEWKRAGPSKQFTALVDLSSVHSACRLCVKAATNHQLKQQQMCPPVSAIDGHLWIRERGQFEYEKIPVGSLKSLTLSQLKESISAYYLEKRKRPVWSLQRKDFFDTLQSMEPYRLYALAENTAKSALFQSDRNLLATQQQLDTFLWRKWCWPLEVIFV